MSEQTAVKQGTIICQECGKEIETVDCSEGVKTWYGVCNDCTNKEKE